MLSTREVITVERAAQELRPVAGSRGMYTSEGGELWYAAATACQLSGRGYETLARWARAVRIRRQERETGTRPNVFYLAEDIDAFLVQEAAANEPSPPHVSLAELRDVAQVLQGALNQAESLTRALAEQHLATAIALERLLSLDVRAKR